VGVLVAGAFAAGGLAGGALAVGISPRWRRREYSVCPPDERIWACSIQFSAPMRLVRPSVWEMRLTSSGVQRAMSVRRVTPALRSRAWSVSSMERMRVRSSPVTAAGTAATGAAVVAVVEGPAAAALVARAARALAAVAEVVTGVKGCSSVNSGQAARAPPRTERLGSRINRAALAPSESPFTDGSGSLQSPSEPWYGGY